MKWNVFSVVLGLEFRILEDGRYDCKWVLLERIKGNLEVRESKKLQGNLVQVLDKIPKHYPVSLSIGGKGIVHKNTGSGMAHADAQMFQLAFPAIAEKEFYVQVFSSAEAGLVSIARKILVDDVLDKMKGSGLQVLSVNLGGIVSSHLWPHLKWADHTLAFDGHVIKLNDKGVFLSYQSNSVDAPCSIQENKLGEAGELVAYASALQLLLHDQIEPVASKIDRVSSDFVNHREKAKIKAAALFFLASLFVLLLISYLLYAHYNQANARLAAQAGHVSSGEEERRQLLANINADTQFLDLVGWNGGYNYGALSDEIGKSKPRQVLLSSISFNDNKQAMTRTADGANILIQGGTNNLVAVNNWIFLFKEKKWVKSVKLLNYKDNAQEENYSFSILIHYGDAQGTGL